MRIDVSPFPTTGNYRAEVLSRDRLTSLSPSPSCPACGASESTPLFQLGGITPDESVVLGVCNECAHVSYDRLPTDEWLARFYADTWDAGNRQIRRDVRPNLTSPWSYVRHVRDLALPRDATILDFGCGFGDG